MRLFTCGADDTVSQSCHYLNVGWLQSVDTEIIHCEE